MKVNRCLDEQMGSEQNSELLSLIRPKNESRQLSATLDQKSTKGKRTPSGGRPIKDGKRKETTEESIRMIPKLAEEYGHQINNWPDVAKAEYYKTPIPELPQGLRSPMMVIAYKGETGSRVLVLCDTQTKITYNLRPSTIEDWEISPIGVNHRSGHSIIVRLTPHMVALHLPSGELYKDAPPPHRLSTKRTRKPTVKKIPS